MKDICCIGHITRDRIVTPAQTVYMAGGTSFYFAYALNQLPKNVSFQLVTKLATEDLQAVDDMQHAGIDVKVHPSRQTVFFENKYGDNPDERTQRVLAKADPFTTDELQAVDARIFHLGTLLADDFSVETVKALARRGHISIDAQGYLREVRGEEVHAIDWQDKREILACTDFLKVNEHEMEVITGLTDPHAAAQQLADWGVSEVIVTLGSAGSLVLAEGRFYEIPAYPPTAVVDATGCGDTYAAGYLYCRAQGMDYPDAGRFAAAMCTLKLQHTGPFDANIDAIQALVGK